MQDTFKETILLPSLRLIREDIKVKRFYFFPSFFSVCFLSLILTYQAIYTYVELLGRQEEALQYILQFIHSDYVWTIVIIGVIIFLFYIVCLPIFEGALIRYLDLKNNTENPSLSASLGTGLFRFYALFEYNSIFNLFKFISIVNAYLFSLRFIGVDYIVILNIVFGIVFIFSILINVFLAYARYEIVLHKKSTFEAIGISTQITLLNFKTTFKLYLLMFLMNIRVFINFIIFCFFPLLALTVTSYITSLIFTTILLSIIALVFFIFLLALGYMASVLEIFTKKMWYQAYMHGKTKLESEES